MLPPFAAVFLKVRSMTEEWPSVSSLVGTNCSLHSVKPFPFIHSKVSCVLGQAEVTPLSHRGWQIFQSPVIIVRMAGSHCKSVMQLLVYIIEICSPSSPL